ncbi:MAG: hypothetical protein H7Z43_04780 [Clostridia bacterium]|nr:hypothetical protein [Deltaproteobacteria bacterium]
MLAELNPDFRDVLMELSDAGVEFIIVGAYALALNGIPRTTGAIDLLVRPDRNNAQRVIDAFTKFGAPVEANGVTADDFATPGAVYQIGLPPRRIDVLTSISGVAFDEAWLTKSSVDLDGRAIHFLDRATLLKNKLASGRPKDLADASRIVG